MRRSFSSSFFNPSESESETSITSSGLTITFGFSIAIFDERWTFVRDAFNFERIFSFKSSVWSGSSSCSGSGSGSSTSFSGRATHFLKKFSRQSLIDEQTYLHESSCFLTKLWIFEYIVSGLWFARVLLHKRVRLLLILFSLCPKR